MKLKCLKLTLSNFHHRVGRTVGLAGAAALASLPVAVDAQGVTPDPSAPPKPHHAYVRFWNMLPKDPVNNLILLSGDKDAMMTLPPSNVFADYVTAPVGNYTLTVRRLDESANAIQRLPVTMPDGTFITLLATEKNGQPTVTMFNDTPDPNVMENGGRITLRQFFPGARITVSVVGGPASKPQNYGDTTVLENVPLTGQVSINLQASLPTTPPSTRTWNLTGDFTKAHHATLLLVADSYGRLRPRLAMDAISPLDH